MNTILYGSVGFYLDEHDEDELKFSALNQIGKLIFGAASAEFFFSKLDNHTQIFKWKPTAWLFHRNLLNEYWKIISNFDFSTVDFTPSDRDFFSNANIANHLADNLPDDEDPKWPGHLAANNAVLVNAITYDMIFKDQPDRIISISRECLNYFDADFLGRKNYSKIIEQEKDRQRKLYSILIRENLNHNDINKIWYESIARPLPSVSE